MQNAASQHTWHDDSLSLSIWLTWLCMNCGITLNNWLKQDVHALSSWCPDVIIFFLRYLDAYIEMVVCVITSEEWQMYWCVFTAQTHKARSTSSGAAQNVQCMTSKYRESDKRADGSNASRIVLAVLWCHTLKYSVQRRLKSNAPIIKRKRERSRA